jgi:protein subunit release factor A
MAKKPKQLLFSLTKKDFEVETFCTGGPGGQHKNAKQNGVRIRHKASGAVAEHRDGRDQCRNKEEAFKKLAETKEFKAWHSTEVSRRIHSEERRHLERIVQQKVDAQMAAINLKVEEYEVPSS